MLHHVVGSHRCATTISLSKLENLGQLPLLQHLDLSNNMFNKVAGLDALPFLEYLNLANNDLMELPDLRHCVTLTVWHMSWVALSPASRT